MKAQQQKTTDNLDAISKEEGIEKNFFYFLKLFFSKSFVGEKQLIEDKLLIDDKKPSEDLKKSSALSPEQERLQKEMDKILSDRNYEFFFKAVQNGYTPSSSQQVNIDQVVEHAINYGPNLDTIEKFLRYGYKMTQDHFVQLFFCENNSRPEDLEALMDLAFRGRSVKHVQHPPFVKAEAVFNDSAERKKSEDLREMAYNQQKHRLSGLSSKQKDMYMEKLGDSVLLKELKEFAKNSETIPLLAKKLLELPKNGYPKRFKLAIYKFNDLLFPHYSRDEYMQLSNTISTSGNKNSKSGDLYEDRRVIHEIQHYMNIAADVFYPEHYESLLSDIKQVYIEKKIEQITATIKQAEIKKYTVKNLPDEAQHIVEKIEDHYKMLVNAKLSQLDGAELELTIEKRIPELLNKYFSIHEDYRDTMVNKDGKNALQLLVSSLNNLETLLIDMMERTQEQKLQDLTVNHRFTENIKKPTM